LPTVVKPMQPSSDITSVSWPIALMRHVRRILLTALLIGFAGATLVRLGPGFGTDEQELDIRLNQQSRQAIQAERSSERNIALFYIGYIGRLMRGDLGFSHSLNRPVTELLAERLPLTLISLGYGVAGGFLLGFLLATLTILWRVAAYDVVSGTLAGLCVSIPSAVVALMFLWFGASGRWAIALVVFPHVYRYARNLLASAYESQHVITALAKGLGRTRILLAHVVVPVLPQLAALAGISVTLAFAASIPIEAICDIPGIGQLAWKAALSRDLPLLVSITMLVGILTLSVNGLADLALETGASR
jgi:peptide/nickel transport system permease protein